MLPVAAVAAVQIASRVLGAVVTRAAVLGAVALAVNLGALDAHHAVLGHD